MTSGMPPAPLPPADESGVRVALAHDWLTGMRGGEKVLEAIADLVPGAPIHTLIHVQGTVTPAIERHPIVPAFTSRLPLARRLYRHFLPLFPLAVELFDFDAYDLIISTSHCAVKSVVTPGRARHLCYCHSPMRYAWDQFPWYFGRERLGPASYVMRPIMRHLARWDAATQGRVDRYVANSQYVAARIRRYYNRESAVVYPPVDTGFFRPTGAPAGDYCLVVSALVPYKRLDLAIAACRLAGRPLRIVGTGPEEARLRRMAGSDVEFMGSRTDEELRALYSMAYAVVLPGIEDFGIVPVEAQACGRPVVALNRGGAAETVIHEVTGLLVDEDTPDAFADALVRLGRLGLEPRAARAQALRFSPAVFREAFSREVDLLLANRSAAALPPAGAGAPVDRSSSRW